MNTETARRRPLSGRTVLISLIFFFAVVALVNGIMIRAAFTTFGGVETASAYQAGLAYAREANAAHAQDALKWQIRASIRVSGQLTMIEIDARDDAGIALAGLSATARLERPTDRRADNIVILQEIGAGLFSGSAAHFAGQWDLVVELSRGSERVFRSRNRVVVN